MLSMLAIVDAVKHGLSERFPTAKIYTNTVPKSFRRPSFLVELGPMEMSDASYGSLEITVTARVAIFTPVDNYANCKAEELIQTMAAVQELFAVEGLRVADRVLHVLGVRGDPQLDFAQVDITMTYQDDRPTSGEWPLMGAIALAVVAKP